MPIWWQHFYRGVANRKEPALARETGPHSGQPCVHYTPLICLTLGVRSMAQVEALQSAFIALIPTAQPERAEKVLRFAISQLVGAPNRPLSERGPTVTGRDLESWYALKDQIRGSGVTLAQVAREVGLTKSAIDHILTANAVRVPSKSTFYRLKDWLNGRKAKDEPVLLKVVAAPTVAKVVKTRLSSSRPKSTG